MARLFTPSESKYYLMALDAGTGSIRAVIFDLEGNQIAVGQAEWRHLAVPDVPGSMEFDLNKNWQLACECMRQALHNAGIAPEYIAAVSACSMREGIVLYNNEGTPIWACANVDARAAREVSELKELHNNTFENEVYRATGQTLALSAIPRLLWLAHHRSDIYRQASTITMISDWLAYMLSGELAVDPSNAGTTGLLDLTTRDWKPALLDMAGLRADILSPVKETGTLLGVVSSQAAEQNDANKTGAYVDSWALYNWFDNSVSSDNRSADDYDSRGVTASVEGGYTFEAGTFSGSEGTLNTWYVQPQAQITWMGVKDSDHTRKDGTRIETEGDGNVQTRLGVKTYLNSHHQRDDGKQREFQPYIEANWINNSKVYAVKMNGQTVGREGARNLGEVRTGVEAKVNNNLSLWGNVGVQLGDKGYSDTQGMLGVKYSW